MTRWDQEGTRAGLTPRQLQPKGRLQISEVPCRLGMLPLQQGHFDNEIEMELTWLDKPTPEDLDRKRLRRREHGLLGKRRMIRMQMIYSSPVTY